MPPAHFRTPDVASQADHAEHGPEWSQSFVSLGGVRLLLAVIERQMLCISSGSKKDLKDYDVDLHHLAVAAATPPPARTHGRNP